MTAVVLQPCAGAAALEHFRDTIASPVNLGDSRVNALIDSKTFADLTALFPDERVPMWGVTPGGANPSKFARAGVGDVVAFSGRGRFFARGIIAQTFVNPALAESLWGRDEKGQTWEYMYALDDVHTIDVPYSEFNSVVGYSINYIPQGFNVLDPGKSARALPLFSGENVRVDPDVTPLEYEQAASVLTGELDREYRSASRTEQGYLRGIHVPGATGVCSLCAKTFPREFLWVGHIKKRSLCSDEERRDARNVAMPCCVFGCDKLFEDGYISVASDGAIVVSDAAKRYPTLRAYVEECFAGANCLAHRDETEPYFAYHRSHQFKGAASTT